MFIGKIFMFSHGGLIAPGSHLGPAWEGRRAAETKGRTVAAVVAGAPGLVPSNVALLTLLLA